jgi:HTH-type transcriptional regulator / antitoxin HigA
MADVKPIKSNDDYERALKDIEALWGAPEGSPRGDKLDVLATLVEAYEAKHFAIDTPDPVSAIEFRMEQQGLTRKDLEGIVGSRARIAEVLSGKRNLSIAMIRRLNEALKIPVEVLIAPTRKNAA